MRRIVSIALLSSATALAGCASSPATDSHLASFCHGYIQKGLGEYPIDDVDRNAMWLSWNEVVPVTLFAKEMDQPSYEKGRTTFGEQMAANDIRAMQSTIASDCDQGENHLWRWW
ncbi:MAG: hypothetical protein QNI86_09200 [Halieaceae bacterium]|nr:hypothetical protein [Halieaceae bacterium]